MPLDEDTPPPEIGGWSDWEIEECSSACLLHSKGFQKRHRTCSSGDCVGLSYGVLLCDDQEICTRNRYLTAENYATMKCKEYSHLIPVLDASSSGVQAPYEEQRLWVSCAIFCKRKDSPVFYSPRLELNDLGGGAYDAYFPDGTLCHRGKDGERFYCQHHHCLPENFKFSKDHGKMFEDDLPFWLGNASPEDMGDEVEVNEMLREYMSLDEKSRRPIRIRLDDEGFIGRSRERETEWNFGEGM